MNRGYLACTAVIIACLAVSALGWLADAVLPMTGWWILPKVIAREAQYGVFLAAFFAFCAALIWVGSRVMRPRERTDAPFWLMIGAAIFGKVALLAMFVASLLADFGYGHPLFIPYLVTLGVLVFGAVMTAFFVQGGVRGRETPRNIPSSC